MSSLYTLNSKLFTYQATPEDWEGFKKKIANERAAALRKYVSSLYTLNCKLFTYQATPEDWEGFKKKIQASHLADTEAILEIANSSVAPDYKDVKIRKLIPTSYRYILCEQPLHLKLQTLYLSGYTGRLGRIQEEDPG